MGGWGQLERIKGSEISEADLRAYVELYVDEQHLKWKAGIIPIEPVSTSSKSSPL